MQTTFLFIFTPIIAAKVSIKKQSTKFLGKNLKVTPYTRELLYKENTLHLRPPRHPVAIVVGVAGVGGVGYKCCKAYIRVRAREYQKNNGRATSKTTCFTFKDDV